MKNAARALSLPLNLTAFRILPPSPSPPPPPTPNPPQNTNKITRKNQKKKPNLFQGGFQDWLYNIKFSQLCAPLTARFGHAAVAPIKVFLDQGLHHPMLYFPFFYGLKAFVEGKPMSSAVEKYKREIKDSCLALWKIWVPAQLVNFAFVPRHLRIPYVAAVSFGWTVVLSTMQGRYAKEEEEAASSSVDKFGKESQELMANIVATGGIPSPASSSSSSSSSSGAAPKKGGDAASPLSAPSRQQLGGLKDIAADAAGGGKEGGRSSSSPAIVAASRAEAAALVAGCATGTGSGAAAA